jgi:phosphate transport system substrate-binding protein
MAQAAGPLVLGGGSSLIFPAITSEIAGFPIAIGQFSYQSVGSGDGQIAFLNDDSTSLSVTSGLTVDFANSDAALTSAQVNTAGVYMGTASATSGPLIQLPYIITPITIPYVNPPPGVPATVVLTDADLCGIFSHQITDWDQLKNGSGNQITPNSAPIKVVYRSDRSGTTDLLTRHLAAVCPAIIGTSFVFNERQDFAGLFTSNGTTVPTYWIGENGSRDVAVELYALRSSGSQAAISYLSPDYTNTTLAPGSTSAAFNQFTVASLHNDISHLDVPPTSAEAQTAVGTIVAPGIIAARNPLNWVPNSANPSVGYPISGTSQIIVSQCYQNANVATAIKTFLNDHYNTAANQTIMTQNGFALLPSTFVTTLTTDFLSTGPLAINVSTATACGGKGR